MSDDKVFEEFIKLSLQFVLFASVFRSYMEEKENKEEKEKEKGD